MATKTPNAVSDDARRLRIELGAVLARKRKEKGLSQKKVADRLGYEYYTTVSQWERGHIRLSTESYEPLARILGEDPDEFSLLLMKYNEPHLYRTVTRLIKKARSEHDKKSD